MSLDNKDKRFVSEDDKFFHDFDKNKPKSTSQSLEAEKAQRIALARDQKASGEQATEVWEGF